MKSFINQILKFFGISGVGWCIDFLIYFFLTFVLGWPVFYSNCVSSIGEYIVKWITNFAIYSKDIQMLAKIIAKIFITPITMLMNFIVMKIMVERV